MSRKLPIGIQGFEKLRNEHFLYVDKTEYVYRLVHGDVPCFLSRPRRFGKSLLLSSMKAYWEGKRELFDGLAISRLEADNREAWKPYPVFYFDFNGMNYNSEDALEKMLDRHLRDWEEIYGDQYHERSLEERFRRLLKTASAEEGRRCVVLVDEYDKPLLEVMEDPQKEEHNRAVFKGFFSTLKSCDEYLQFVFITGVTKFSKVSIFSDLNQLKDISMTEEYADICGITEEELRAAFGPEIEKTALVQGLTLEECLRELKDRYDGYHFTPNGKAVYNPFSLLSAFYDKDFGSYWFSTGTPSFLVKKLKGAGFDVRKLTDGTLYANEAAISDYRTDNPDPVPLLYQTGYLTISGYDRQMREYTLASPNKEVRYGLLESLLPEYVDNYGPGSGKDIFTLRRLAERGDIQGMMDVLTALFAGITYTTKNDLFEHYFQTVIYLVFTLLGSFVQCEMHTFTGRIDCRVETSGYLYLFEFKRDKSADEALRQIDENNYTLPFKADGRKLYRIGVSFDSKKRILADWKVRE